MARPSLARRLVVAAMLTTLVLSAAACGGDDSTATDTSSSETPGDTGEGDLEELSAEAFAPAVVAALQEAETMGFSISTGVGSTALDMTGELRYVDGGLEASAATTGTQAFEMVMLDQTLYISAAEIPLPDGKKWAKLDLSDPNSLFGQLGKSADPTMMVDALETAIEFELLGTEEVDGVETNHYNFVMDTASYAKAMSIPAETARVMPKEFATEMWIDADNRPRKFRQEIEIPDMTGSGQSTTTTGTYFDFGTEVEIEAPPAADVADNIPGLS